MEEQDKDIDLTFIPQVGFGEILFSFNEDQVLHILGDSAERNIDYFNTNEYALYLDYWDYNIFISLHFENSTLERLSIHTQNIILDDFCFSHHNQSEILSFIRRYHYTHNLNFTETVEFNEEVKETCYIYNRIGLTIWFDENGISDICLQKTEV